MAALGIFQTLLEKELPGATWFIVRLAVSFPFILGWRAMAGRTPGVSLGGGIFLAFLLSAYGHYLAPVGLPNESLRLTMENPPAVNVHWLGYRDKFLIILPVSIIICAAVLWLFSQKTMFKAGDASAETRTLRSKADKRLMLTAIVGAAALLIVGAMSYKHTGPEASIVNITASGNAAIEYGAHFNNNMMPVNAEIKIQTRNANDHRTPLDPNDQIHLQATIAGAEGSTYMIKATDAMVSDPLGRYTTWGGVGYDVWHHGRSGIGTPKLPATHSDVAGYALGEVWNNGKHIASAVPIHIMTTDKEKSRLELHVGDPDMMAKGLPQEELRVVWDNYVSDYSRAKDYALYAWGGTWQLLLLIAMFIAARSEDKRETA